MALISLRLCARRTKPPTLLSTADVPLPLFILACYVLLCFAFVLARIALLSAVLDYVSLPCFIVYSVASFCFAFLCFANLCFTLFFFALDCCALPGFALLRYSPKNQAKKDQRAPPVPKPNKIDQNPGFRQLTQHTTCTTSHTITQCGHPKGNHNWSTYMMFRCLFLCFLVVALLFFASASIYFVIFNPYVVLRCRYK